MSSSPSTDASSTDVSARAVSASGPVDANKAKRSAVSVTSSGMSTTSKVSVGLSWEDRRCCNTVIVFTLACSNAAWSWGDVFVHRRLSTPLQVGHVTAERAVVLPPSTVGGRPATSRAPGDRWHARLLPRRRKARHDLTGTRHAGEALTAPYGLPLLGSPP